MRRLIVAVYRGKPFLDQTVASCWFLSHVGNRCSGSRRTRSDRSPPARLLIGIWALATTAGAAERRKESGCPTEVTRMPLAVYRGKPPLPHSVLSPTGLSTSPDGAYASGLAFLE